MRLKGWRDVSARDLSKIEHPSRACALVERDFYDQHGGCIDGIDRMLHEDVCRLIMVRRNSRTLSLLLESIRRGEVFLIHGLTEPFRPVILLDDDGDTWAVDLPDGQAHLRASLTKLIQRLTHKRIANIDGQGDGTSSNADLASDEPEIWTPSTVAAPPSTASAPASPGPPEPPELDGVLTSTSLGENESTEVSGGVTTGEDTSDEDSENPDASNDVAPKTLTPEYVSGFDEASILSIPKGDRPSPSTYLTQSYQDAHEDLFKDGAVRIQPSVQTGKIGRTETWVFPKSLADDAIASSDGDVRALEKMLGLDDGYLGNSPVRVDIPNPSGYRIPTGNEFGANSFWRPGGVTWPGGLPEAVIDPVPAGKYVVTSIFGD